MLACTVVPGQPDSARVDDVSDPPAKDGEILVSGRLVGVCGTDMEIVEEGYGWVPPGHDRLVLFHESLGEVVDAPAGSGFSAGDLVAGVVRRPDPVPCPCCAADQWDFCRNGRYTERGIKERDGYGSQQWRVEPKFAVKLDRGLGDLGVLLEPTSVVAKAWDQVDAVLARVAFEPATALVTGAGPIGLLAALIGVQRGLDVHVLDRVTEGPKPGLARDLGARYHNDLDDLGAAPDVVIEATGAGQLVFETVQHAAKNAVVCLTGISAGGRSVSTDLGAINKEMVLTNEVIVGSVNAARKHYEMAAQTLAQADPTWLERLISRRVPMADWSQALHREDDDVKVVVDLRS
jgi:threonine dehydrogenase-like Zn-dependent dehydrogenase